MGAYIKYKFVNSNNFPVFVPDTRGGQILFRPGEGSTDQWFSRFLGKGQLTKVSIKNKVVIEKPPIKEPEKEQSVIIKNVDDIAKAIAQVLSKVNVGGPSGQVKEKLDIFDEGASFNKLADAMTKPKESKEASFEKLGQRKVVKKDKETVDRTRDFLSNIKD